MPHAIWLSDDEYVLIPRVSDIVSASQCEMTAWLNPINKAKRENRQIPLEHAQNIYALRGTIVHHRIENELRKILNMPKTPLEFNYGERNLFNLVSNDKELSTNVNKHIELCMDNFYDFLDESEMKPLVTEQSLVYLKKDKEGNLILEESLKGTVDLIGEMQTENGWETVLIDWKSSKQFKSTFGIQLTGYGFLMDACNKWKELREQGIITHPQSVWSYKDGNYDVERALCVIFGNDSGYKQRWYDTSDRDFFRYWEVLKHPKRSLRNPSTGSWGMKMLCMMCQYKPECDLYYYWVEGEENGL